MKSSTVAAKPPVDVGRTISPGLTAAAAKALAIRTHERIRYNYMLSTSCVESSFLFERTWNELASSKAGSQSAALNGWTAQRVVSQSQALSPALVQMLKDGASPEEVLGAYKQEDENQSPERTLWMVSAGFAQEPGDYVGRTQAERNRYVAHLICALTHPQSSEAIIVDPSAEQFHRPNKGLHITAPVTGRVLRSEFNDGTVALRVSSDAQTAVVRYFLHHNLDPLKPRTDKILSRWAKSLAKSTLSA